MDMRPESATAVLTVEEAAAILRIGRTAAYAAAREFRRSGGREGLPCLEFGRTLRVPFAALYRYLEGAGAPAGPLRVGSEPAREEATAA